MAFQAVDIRNASTSNEATCRTDTSTSSGTETSTQTRTNTSTNTQNGSQSRTSSSTSARTGNTQRSSSQSGSKVQVEKDDVGCVIRFRVPVVVQFPGDP